MDEIKDWYKNLTYDEADGILMDNIPNVKRTFMAIGHCLKFIRDNKLYIDGGYTSLWEYADKRFGIKRTTALRWMEINDKFSKQGNSPIIDPKYQKFSRSQLQEMLNMTHIQLEKITSDMSIKDIRKLKEFKIKGE